MNAFFKDVRTIERMQEGPLGHHIAQFAAGLRADGFTRLTGRVILATVAGFNRWLKLIHVSPSQISSGHAEKYLQFRRRGTSRSYIPGRATLARWLKLLREQGVVPEPAPPTLTPGQKVLRDYDNYLQSERSLASHTRANYRSLARQFLTNSFGEGQVDLSTLRGSDVIEWVRRRAKRFSSEGAQAMTAAIRSFLQFARYRGDVSLDLAACVPSVASWSLSGIPKSLPSEQVAQVLAHCPRTTAVGRRDYAILLLLARLGLRAREVVDLTLDDIEWETSRIRIRDKMSRLDQLASEIRPAALLPGRRNQR